MCVSETETETETEREREKEKEIQKKTLSPNGDVCEIFDYWKKIMNHPKAQLDDPRKKIIKTALKHYTGLQLMDAIDGCKATPRNMGHNDRGEIYDGLHIIMRDAEQIDRFIANKANPPTPKTKEQLESEVAAKRVYNI
jgi:hypothetical protein